MATLFTNIADKGISIAGKNLENDLNSLKKGEILSLNLSLTDEDVIRIFSSKLGEQLSDIDSLCLSFESYSKISNKSLKLIAHKCHNIKSINLKSCMTLSDDGVIPLVKALPFLEEIDLSWCDISEKSLIELSKNCPKLKKIGLRSCYVTDEAVISLVTNCPDLVRLNLAWCKSLTNMAVKAISDYCHKLVELDLKGNEKITSDAVAVLVENNSLLEVFHLKRSQNAISDNVISKLVQHNMQLKKLNIRGCYKSTNNISNFSNNIFKEIGKYSSNLKVIDTAWCSILDDSSLCCLIEGCTELESLDISGASLITNKSMHCILHNLALKKLILFKNPLITQSSIQALRNKGCEVKEY